MKNILIIGGNCDIGKKLSKYYLDNGCNLVVGYYKNIDIIDSRIKYIKCDVRYIDNIENIIKISMDMYGTIDVIINLSCICMDSYFLDKTKDEFMRVLEVNLVGTFLCNQVYSKYMDDGMIINVASTDGVDTYNEYNIDYAASKAGIINISKSISRCTNNKVLCLVPNWIDTSSTKNMDKEFLEKELERIGQNKLITLDEFIIGYDKIINSNFNSGDIFRIDIKGDNLWVEKM